MGKRQRRKAQPKRPLPISNSAVPWFKTKLFLPTLVCVVILVMLAWFLIPSLIKSRMPHRAADYQYRQFAREALREVAQENPRAALLYRLLEEKGVDAISHQPYKYTFPPGSYQLGKGQFLLVLIKYQVPGNRPFASYISQTHALEILGTSVSKQWLGLVLVHELSHVNDHIRGVTNSSVTINQDLYVDREFVAFDLESELADKITGGRFFEEVDKVLRERNIAYPEMFLGVDRSILSRLNSLFDQERSPKELTTRHTLFVYVLNKQIVGSSDLLMGEKQMALRRWYRRLVQEQGLS